jgi:hypothetical protein
VNLVAYADESGTHDPTGGLIGANAVAISGLVALKEEWGLFDLKWRAILKKFHDVKYFHAREHHSAWLVVTGRSMPNSGFKNNPYKNWSNQELNDFIMALAPLAASNLIVGGWVPTKLYHEDKLAGVPDKDRHPYELCLDHFFDSVVTSVDEHRAPWKRQPVAFLFDNTDDVNWRQAITDRFHAHQLKHRRFCEIGFRKKTEHTPLQAADLVSYRVRHNMGLLAEMDFSKTWPELDSILFKQIDDWMREGGNDRFIKSFNRVFTRHENP